MMQNMIKRVIIFTKFKIILGKCSYFGTQGLSNGSKIVYFMIFAYSTTVVFLIYGPIYNLVLAKVKKYF